ncbi:hypothetical protein MC885_017477, partial [Smutsia gigantea]
VLGIDSPVAEATRRNKQPLSAERAEVLRGQAPSGKRTRECGAGVRAARGLVAPAAELVGTGVGTVISVVGLGALLRDFPPVFFNVK